MSVSGHIDSLKRKHQQVSKKLERAYMHHCPDDELAQLKKIKLRLKDELMVFENMADAHNDNVQTIH